ncbi:MAG: patatin-like phospholipase family protein [Candidatus Omnitrophica bacterium]|jgi:NTE family protein|nr:patatin-like phospholipase family protein [Candidatus Omnitrophota bacterium]MDD3988169.1 patatin-like phospholipase family protein [Candidatus Omnitrophota bacterium]MDD4981784.1 patatin-like phospholipase family protein [Candidatus Omnitrophota bacterium]MDD5665185.1 patatin-like phospholipase family protein [Candidatus Omnitrophota bacterium]
MMELDDLDVIIRDFPLFAGLSKLERRVIKRCARLAPYKKGDIIYAEGSPPSAFYCLILGRVVIYTLGEDGKENILEHLHHGKYFGVISLLTNESHSVTAKATNDSSLLIIDKEDFDCILAKLPRLAIDLSRMLSRRLKRKDIHQKTIFESTVVSVFSSHSQAGKTVYALNLALSLKRETRKSVIILDILPLDKRHSLPYRLGIQDQKIFDLAKDFTDGLRSAKDFILKSKFDVDLLCFYYNPEDEACVRRLVGILSGLVNDYHYLVLDLPSLMDRNIFSILNQSDIIHLLSGPDDLDLKKTHNLTQRLMDEFGFQENKINIIINEYKLSKITPMEQSQILGRNIFATLPRIVFGDLDRLILDSPDCEYSRAVRRIARYIGESMVGLVLGVGVGYGFCHIGVLKVIEEENIPIDIIAGSSIGSLIASLWATGKSSSEILEITGEFKEPKHIWGLVDLTIPQLGFIKGNKLHRFLKKYLGDKTFYDVRLPLKIIASDVKRKEPRVLDKGLLVDAVMASCAMPGVFKPFRFKEDLLFDGGVINPLPTEPLFKMGVKKIIAVNVTPSREDILRQYDRIKEDMKVNLVSGLKKKNWFNLGNYFKNSFGTNILDIVFSSVEILQSEVAKKEAQLADVVLHPDTSGLYWLELHKAREFAKRGEEEARKNLDKIWQVIND